MTIHASTSAALFAAVVLLISHLTPSHGSEKYVSLTFDTSGIPSPKSAKRPISPLFDTVSLKTPGQVVYNQAKDITYWGGPVMYNPIKVYLIWLGYISDARKTYVRNFINSLSTSTSASNTVQSWWAITQLYTDTKGRSVSSTVSVGGELNILDFTTVPQMGSNTGEPYDNYTEWQLSDLRGGASLMAPSMGGVFGIAETAMLQKKLPVDPNGIYVVFSNESVWQGDYDFGFCNLYCGWHMDAYSQGQTLKYLWLGISGEQHGGCGCTLSIDYPLPLNDPPIATAVSVLAHELAETATDPVPWSGWFQNGTNMEVGDLCSWFFAPLRFDPVNHAAYNLVGLGGTEYLIQRLWNPATSTCTMTKSR